MLDLKLKSNSSQTQVQFKLSSSWTQFEYGPLDTTCARGLSYGTNGLPDSDLRKVGREIAKSREGVTKKSWRQTKKSLGQTKKSSGRSAADGWTGEIGLVEIPIGLVENRFPACGDFNQACGFCESRRFGATSWCEGPYARRATRFPSTPVDFCRFGSSGRLGRGNSLPVSKRGLQLRSGASWPVPDLSSS